MKKNSDYYIFSKHFEANKPSNEYPIPISGILPSPVQRKRCNNRQMCNMKDVAVPLCDINLSLSQSTAPSTSNRSTACSLKRQIEDKDEHIKQLKEKIKLLQ